MVSKETRPSNTSPNCPECGVHPADSVKKWVKVVVWILIALVVVAIIYMILFGWKNVADYFKDIFPEVPEFPDYTR